jgi:alpha 1,2-mannosyltransferase
MAILTFVQRQSRLVAVFLAVVLIYLAFMSWRLDLTATLQSHLLPTTATPENPTAKEHVVPPKTKPKLETEAHKLPNADAFAAHFEAVKRLPGMTMAEAKSGCTWPSLDGINFQYGADVEWNTIERNDGELEARRRQWHSFLDTGMLPYSDYKDRFKGRGIVIVAGNGKSMNRVKAVLRQLKRLGSKMAVEIHYWDDEMDPVTENDLKALWPEVYFNDLSARSNVLETNNNNVYHLNYQLKTAAVVNSRFAEPLLLDSDNVPILDPAELYETPLYKEFGTLFWPDIARTRPANPMWAITNTQCRMDEFEQESGQLLVDKRKYFYHLQLAAWFNNEHPEYFNQFLLGDKDLFRFAWHALKTTYGFPPKWITSVGTISGPDKIYCGHSFAQHHPDGRVAFMHGGLVKTIPKEVLAWHRKEHGGIYQGFKKTEFDEQHNVTIRVGISFDPAMYLPNRPENLTTSWCTDYYEIAPRPMEELLPDFGKTFDEIGGYWMLEEEGSMLAPSGAFN